MGNVTVQDFRKYDKLKYKHEKLKLDIDFLNNCKQLGVYPKFLIFKLPNVSNKDASWICKRVLCSAINKQNKELQHVLKEVTTSLKNLQYRTTINHYRNRYILNRKSYLHWQEVAAYLYSQLAKLLLTSCNINYPKKNSIYLKQIYTFQSNQIQFEIPKSLLPLKRFLFLLLTTLTRTKPKVRQNGVSRILLILIPTTTNLLHVYYVNIVSYEALEKIKTS